MGKFVSEIVHHDLAKKENWSYQVIGKNDKFDS